MLGSLIDSWAGSAYDHMVPVLISVCQFAITGTVRPLILAALNFCV